MKGILILSGGGDIKESWILDERYFSLLPSHAKILYIPIALKREGVGFEACYDWFSTVISRHAKEKDIDFSMILENDEVPDLQTFDSIYFGGGNTFKLLDYIVNKTLRPQIINYLNSGRIIYGGSAGAIIFGKDIRTVEEENNNNYSYSLGFNLLNDYSIICHYESSSDKEIIKKTQKIGSQIIALPENSGLIISQNVAELVGTVMVFNVDGSKNLFKDEELMLSKI
jgi:dipeptidase E